jgi:Cysteinyl-tRNA synthetase
MVLLMHQGNGDVYLEVKKVKDYLSLSNQKLDDLLVADDADLKFKKILKILRFGKLLKKVNHHGQHHGEMADLAGISSALQWHMPI